MGLRLREDGYIGQWCLFLGYCPLQLCFLMQPTYTGWTEMAGSGGKGATHYEVLISPMMPGDDDQAMMPA